MALPAAAAVVELTPPLVMPEIAQIFHDEGRLDLPEADHPDRLPPMFMKVKEWSAVARKLIVSGLAHAIPVAAAPSSRSRSLASGVFGVSKPESELRRVIVDRRRKNCCERSLREAAFVASVAERWSDQKFMEVVREMTLPHPMQFRDLFM
eukprot:6461779-Amphidinium_carterae.1